MIYIMVNFISNITTFVISIKIILLPSKLRALIVFSLQSFFYITILIFIGNSISKNMKLRVQFPSVEESLKLFFNKASEIFELLLIFLVLIKRCPKLGCTFEILTSSFLRI